MSSIEDDFFGMLRLLSNFLVNTPPWLNLALLGIWNLTKTQITKTGIAFSAFAKSICCSPIFRFSSGSRDGISFIYYLSLTRSQKVWITQQEGIPYDPKSSDNLRLTEYFFLLSMMMNQVTISDRNYSFTHSTVISFCVFEVSSPAYMTETKTEYRLYQRAQATVSSLPSNLVCGLQHTAASYPEHQVLLVNFIHTSESTMVLHRATTEPWVPLSAKYALSGPSSPQIDQNGEAKNSTNSPIYTC